MAEHKNILELTDAQAMVLNSMVGISDSLLRGDMVTLAIARLEISAWVEHDPSAVSGLIDIINAMSRQLAERNSNFLRLL